MLKAVIFDLDETLISSKDSLLDFFRRMYAHVGKPFPEEIKELFYTAPEKGLLERLLPDPADLAKAGEFASDFDFSLLVEKLSLKPHAMEAIEALHGRRKLAIATNRGDTTTGVLKNFDLEDRFDFVVNSRTLEHPKPHPVVVETILAELGVSMEEAIFIGDSQVDVDTARAGKIPCVIVGEHARENLGDYAIEDLGELPGLLDRLDEGDGGNDKCQMSNAK